MFVNSTCEENASMETAAPNITLPKLESQIRKQNPISKITITTPQASIQMLQQGHSSTTQKWIPTRIDPEWFAFTIKGAIATTGTLASNFTSILSLILQNKMQQLLKTGQLIRNPLSIQNPQRIHLIQNRQLIKNQRIGLPNRICPMDYLNRVTFLLSLKLKLLRKKAVIDQIQSIHTGS